MADTRPDLPARPSTSSGANASPSVSAIRQRMLHRQSSNGSLRSPELPRRRSSILSLSSIEDATTSFAEELVNPAKSVGNRVLKEEQDSHWHSTPLAFAILPAIAGLLFNNGSAFVTDVLLLGFAAVFMNWSIRMPREWYYAAQAVESRPEGEEEEDLGSIPEALDEDDLDLNATPDGSPKDKSEAERSTNNNNNSSYERERASTELRRQELLALAATFLLPAIAAYLLHLIRAQLSRPSTGLVSDYNLCVFLLAAEFWPCRQVARLITHRTLHLQRTATGVEDPDNRSDGKAAISALTTRLTELEAKLSDHTMLPQKSASIAQQTDLADLSAELRKRYEPRLEGLERAVRRYEKRSATLAMVTEQRLQALEGRLHDALSLAAVAAQKSQSQDGILAAISSLVAFPFKLAIAVVMWPVKVTEEVYLRLKALLIGPMPGSQAAGKKAAMRRDDRMREKEKGGIRKSAR